MSSSEAALAGCDRILQDEFSDYPEKALYMIGTIDEAVKVNYDRDDETPSYIATRILLETEVIKVTAESGSGCFCLAATSH
ncbi:MAG UNVERIFIED_CONTAM: hypothetical protein LVR29_04385 [Microcystis novacekii LVE1205-3]